jgi:hypothetical protein
VTVCRPLLLSLLTVVALQAGCTTTTSGQARPTADDDATVGSTTASSDEDDLPTNGAPKVDDPIDTARFQEDPCLSFTAAQSGELDLGAAGTSFNGPLGRACRWENPSTRGEVQVRFLDDDRVGSARSTRRTRTASGCSSTSCLRSKGIPSSRVAPPTTGTSARVQSSWGPAIRSRSRSRCNSPR